MMFVVSVAAGRTMQAVSIKTFYELRKPPSSVFSFETKQLIQGTFELKSLKGAHHPSLYQKK